MLSLLNLTNGYQVPNWLFDIIVPGQTGPYHRPTPPGIAGDSNILLLAGAGIVGLSILSFMVLRLRRNRQHRDG